ncbi:MAG TPA: hypothetical protein PLV06_08490 [Bacteroidales bacterium]|nr:hypothetical protein [Bacteroidales bacterium]HPF01711.1 hypothetical protein [Bacteroidales bacterium]HPJ58720.1 hypothetical protein [Bacteroidales bacterium]HPR12407.1 hypothetical protein [Bacteroidales bacterium]HRW84627.1 hypothetical protein [Bacteroidales bacterium]
MLSVFKGTGPGVIAATVIALLLLWIHPLAYPAGPGDLIYEVQPMPLYEFLKVILGHSPLPGVITSFLFLSFMLFLLVHFNTTVFFINQRTFLPAIVYLLLTSLLPDNQVLNPVLPAALLLMLAMMRIMDAYRKQGVAYNFFDAAFLIGTGSMLYAGLLWFGVLTIVGIAILRRVTLSEILLSLIGILTPYLIVAGFYFVSGREVMELLEVTGKNLFEKAVSFEFSPEQVVALISSGILLIVSIVFLMARIHAKKIRSRKTFFLLLWGLLISVPVYFAIPSVSVEIMWIAAIPASYIITHYFVFSSSRVMPRLIFSGLVLMVVMVQLFSLFNH